MVCFVLPCRGTVLFARRNINSTSPKINWVNQERKTKVVNEISELRKSRLVGCGKEDQKTDGRKIAFMSRVMIAQPHLTWLI